MAPKKEKIPPPGNKKDPYTNFMTRGKWKTALLKVSLDISGKNVRAPGALIIGSSLAKNKTLTTIDLSHNHLGDSGVVNLAQALKLNIFIQNLNLSCNEITDVGGIALASAFVPCANPTGQHSLWNRSVYYVNLSGNLLKDDTLLAMCNAIACHKDFSRLDLSYNQIGPLGCKSLPRAMIRNNLCSIVLSANRVQDEGVEYITAAWKRLGTKGAQAYLDLFQNDLGKNSGYSIGRLLENNNFVTDINLANNTLGPSGVEGLLSPIMNTPSMHVLRCINLQDNLLEDQGASYVATLIASNPPTLIKLNINQNHITDKGGEQITAALKVNKFLQFLLMANNSFGQGTYQNILEVVSEEGYNKILKFVDVKSCGLTIEMVRELADTAHKDVRVDYGTNDMQTTWEVYLSTIGDIELKKAADEEKEKRIKSYGRKKKK